MSARPPVTLGDCIRQLRTQQRQIHNGRPWAQEDLAVAIGSNKSHINRIERGHQEPSGRTLQRICDALELPWRDRALLFGLAGYLPPVPPPTPQEVQAVRQESILLLQEAGHPLRLEDNEQRLCDLNDTLAYVLFGRSHRESVLDHVGGKHTLELLFAHPFGRWWQRTIENFDEFVRWTTADALEFSLRRYGGPALPPNLERLLAIREFRDAWDALATETADGVAISPVRREIALNHPRLGHCHVLVQKSLLAHDERFALMHFIAADHQTRETFAELTKALGPRHRTSVVA